MKIKKVSSTVLFTTVSSLLFHELVLVLNYSSTLLCCCHAPLICRVPTMSSFIILFSLPRASLQMVFGFFSKKWINQFQCFMSTRQLSALILARFSLLFEWPQNQLRWCDWVPRLLWSTCSDRFQMTTYLTPWLFVYYFSIYPQLVSALDHPPDTKPKSGSGAASRGWLILRCPKPLCMTVQFRVCDNFLFKITLYVTIKRTFLTCRHNRILT